MKFQKITLKTLFETKRKHREFEKISDRHRNRHKKVNSRRFERKRRERTNKISQIEIFKWLSIILILRRFDVFNRYLTHDHYFTSPQILFFTFLSRHRQRRRQQQHHLFIMWCVSKLDFMIISSVIVELSSNTFFQPDSTRRTKLKTQP
jgi:hypothetical protein